MLTKNNFGWPVTILLSLSPLVLWSIALLPISYRFYNEYAIYTSLGEITGLVGITMFSLSLVLSARVEAFEDFFGGMNRVYIAHHILGGMSLILLLLHPLFLAFSRVTISWHQAALFLLPGGDWSINFGIIGLISMIFLLLLTFFIKIPYHIWHFSHKFLGAVFLIGTIHGFYVASDIQRFPPLFIYMLIIVGIGTVAFCYRTLLGRFLVRRTKYYVTSVTKVKENVIQIILNPLSKQIKALPGQFIFTYFLSKNVSKETHPFSVAAINPDGSITLAAKVEGDYTKTLANIQTGDTAVIEGGYGRFTYTLSKNKNQIWIAGGIGIVPFLSMAQTLTDPTFHIYLYYSVRTPDEAVYLDILTQFSQANPNLQIIPCYSQTMGHLTAEIIAKQIPETTKYDFFLCGPPMMMKTLRSQLRKIQVPTAQIHSEEFSL